MQDTKENTEHWMTAKLKAVDPKMVVSIAMKVKLAIKLALIASQFGL